MNFEDNKATVPVARHAGYAAMVPLVPTEHLCERAVWASLSGQWPLTDLVATCSSPDMPLVASSPRRIYMALLRLHRLAQQFVEMQIYIKATEDRQTRESCRHLHHTHPSTSLVALSIIVNHLLSLSSSAVGSVASTISICYYELGRFAETAILAGVICEYRPPHAFRLES